tara:strand:+ start:2000 stop:3265 length:1266 start_codon:yes stop_codon:yes gene_type:complete
MNITKINEIKSKIHYEVGRTKPPEGFPKFHDIPKGRYTSQEFYDLEQKYVFSDSWVVAGREDQIPRPGDFFTFKKLGEPMLLIRGKDGLIRCFYNTCQHRGAPVVRDEAGSSKRLRCQYHSWSYDITDGSLVAVPDEHDFVDLDRTQRCLPKVSCETLEGFIFVNKNPDAEPLLTSLGTATEMLKPLHNLSLKEVYRESIVVPCNWKVTAEAFLEVYHFKHIHSNKEGWATLDSRRSAMGLYPGGHSRMITGYSDQHVNLTGMQAWDDWKPLDNGDFKTMESTSQEYLDMLDCTSTAVSYFPNTIIPLGSFGYPVLLFWPIDIETTLLEWWYYGPEDWEGSAIPEHWQKRAKQFNQIMDEDKYNMAPMWESLKSPALTGIPISYQERRIWHLHEEIDRKIGYQNIPDELLMDQVLEPHLER